MSAFFNTAVLQTLLPLNKGVRVLATGPWGLVALEKPCAIRSHPNAGNLDKGALLYARYDLNEGRYFWNNPENAPDKAPQTLWLLNRLDAPTSGVVLACLDEKGARAARECFSRAEVEKIYYALVKGRVHPPKGIWRDRLSRQHSDHGVRVGAGGALEAISAYEMKESGARRTNAALLKLAPKTGRTHQLRVQCALHGHPILGDRTYGDFAWNRQLAASTGEKRLFLHCAATRLAMRIEGQTVRFSAQSPLPESFSQVAG